MTFTEICRSERLTAARACTKAALAGLLLFVAPAALRAQPAPAQQQQQQQPAAGQMRLAKIEFTGLERVKQEEALAASGLAAGQDVDISAIDAAADKLLQSGLFAKLGYSVKGTSAAATVVFAVEEAKRGIPVVFDNFVWFEEEEVLEAVRRKVPSFDGTAPAGGAMTEAIRAALQDLLRTRKIEGVVEYTPSADVRQRPEHLFVVKGAALRVCEVRYPGAGGIPEKELIENSSGIFNNDYSRTFAANYFEAALLPLYRERGRLRATYRTPRATPVSKEDCNGVAVSIPVEEGVIYTWERALWQGNQALTAEELNSALGMKTGEVAASKKLDKGIRDVAKLYGRKGHLGARLTPVPDFNDADRRVAFRFRVDEGPQYRMGALTIGGLGEAEANNLRGRWRILPKEVYDAGYLAEFVNVAVKEFVADMLRSGQRLPNFKIESDIKPNRDTETVDVTLNFKPEETKKQ